MASWPGEIFVFHIAVILFSSFRYTLHLLLSMAIEPKIWKLVRCDEADPAVCITNRGLYSEVKSRKDGMDKG